MRRVRKLLYLPLVLGLPSCTIPVRPEEARLVPAEQSSAVGNSSITITRDAGVWGMACTFHIAVDGRSLGKLDPGERLYTRLQPGKPEVSASNSFWCGGGLEYYTLDAQPHVASFLSVGSSEQVIVIRHDRDIAQPDL